MKPSRYVKIARIMMQIIKRARTSPYLHKTSNHMYTVWQHLILLALRQYESKSYRMFVDFLDECIGVQKYLGLSILPHYTTLQKAAARLDTAMLQKVLESFVIHAKIKNMFAGIDATGFGHTQASYYYTKRIKLRRKFVKMSAVSDMREQLVCAVKIRHRQRHDSVDFTSLLHKANNILPVYTIVADKGYDSEKNHITAHTLGIASIIPTWYEYVPVYKTRGYHRKMLKRKGYDSVTYHQRNKTETIFSVIKMMFGENVTSRKIATQNRELMYRVIAYNAYRITRDNLTNLAWFLHGLQNNYVINKK
ncbi:MAG: Transposase family protein [Nitrosarchaeum sp.]|nr:Transposase family protein [Nitrosarchaeum sp.]